MNYPSYGDQRAEESYEQARERAEEERIFQAGCDEAARLNDEMDRRKIPPVPFGEE